MAHFKTIFFLSFTYAVFAYATPSAPAPFLFEDLKNMIVKNNFKSVDDVLPKLPTSMLSQYALVFDSRSLQKASFEFPRAILYGDDANLVVTFNGHSNQDGFNSLETMQFNQITKKFEFREITFDKILGSVKFSEANPSRCTQCHGIPARPIWDAYFLWPGVYGSAEDGATRAEGAEQDGHPLEIAHYQKFWANRNSRYLNLLPYIAKGHPNNNPNENLNKLLGRLNNQSISQELLAHDLRPYRYAILASFICHPEPKDRGEILPSSLKIEEFIPHSQRSLYLNPSEIIQDTAEERALSFKNRMTRQKDLLPGEHTSERLMPHRRFHESALYLQHPYSMETIVRLRYLLEKSDRSLRNWSMSNFPVRRYEFNNASVSLDLVISNLWQGLLDPSVDQEIYKTFTTAQEETTSIDNSKENKYFYKHSEIKLETCENLRQKSLAEIGSAGELKTPLEQRSTPLQRALRTCLQCHASGVNKAPIIPFDNASEFKKYLAQPGSLNTKMFDEINDRLDSSGEIQMPPIEKLPRAESQALKEYLRFLSPP